MLRALIHLDRLGIRPTSPVRGSLRASDRTVG